MAINWTPELEQEIVDRILAGEAIADILDSVKISSQSFYRRKAQVAEFGANIARAQEEAQDAWVDRTEKLMLTATPENWQVIQFQCRHIAWIAGKRKPKKYGDKIQQEITGELGIKTVVVVGQAKDVQKPELKPSFTPELTSGAAQ